MLSNEELSKRIREPNFFRLLNEKLQNETLAAAFIAEVIKVRQTVDKIGQLAITPNNRHGVLYSELYRYVVECNTVNDFMEAVETASTEIFPHLQYPFVEGGYRHLDIFREALDSSSVAEDLIGYGEAFDFNIRNTMFNTLWQVEQFFLESGINDLWPAIGYGNTFRILQDCHLNEMLKILANWVIEHPGPDAVHELKQSIWGHVSRMRLHTLAQHIVTHHNDYPQACVTYAWEQCISTWKE